MIKKYILFVVITIVTTIVWYKQNTSSDFLIDGIFISSVVVTIVAVVTSICTWLLLSWSNTENRDNVIVTSQNLMIGIIPCYVVMSFISSWIGPIAGIVIGVVTSILCYGVFLIKKMRFG